MANHYNTGTGTVAANAKSQVGNLVSFTIYAAAAANVTTYDAAGNALGTYVVGSNGAVTITDFADQVACDHVYRLHGLVSTTVV